MNGWDWVKAIVSGDGGVVQDSVNSDGESGNGEFDGAVMEIGLFRGAPNNEQMKECHV